MRRRILSLCGFVERQPRPQSCATIVAVVLGYGLVVRSSHYLSLQSLWLDEAKLALNLIERHGFQILEPLAYDQAAPWGFLLLQEAVTRLLGTGELALRMVSYVSSLLAMLLFWSLARRLLRPGPAIWALLLSSGSWLLVAHSANAKPYMLDLFVALSLWWLAFRRGPQSRLFVGAAALAVWISFPAVFVSAGLAGAETLARIRTGERSLRSAFWSRHVIWIASFVLYYLIGIRPIATNPFLYEYWAEALLPAQESAPPIWLAERLFDFVYSGVGLATPRIAAALVVVGGIALGWRKPRPTSWLAGALLATLSAAALGLFPFSGRLVLFLTPVALLFLTEALDAFVRRRDATGAAVATLLAGAVATAPLGLTLERAFDFHDPRNVRELVRKMDSSVGAGRAVRVVSMSEKSFRYYSYRLGATFDYDVLPVQALFEPSSRSISCEQPRWYAASAEILPGHPYSVLELLQRSLATTAVSDSVVASGAGAYKCVPAPQGGG